MASRSRILSVDDRAGARGAQLQHAGAQSTESRTRFPRRPTDAVDARASGSLWRSRRYRRHGDARRRKWPRRKQPAFLSGTILSAINGELIDSGRQLSRAVRKKEEGDVVTIELYRDGSLESYPVTVGERERPVIDLAPRFSFHDGYAVYGRLSGPRRSHCRPWDFISMKNPWKRSSKPCEDSRTTSTAWSGKRSWSASRSWTSSAIQERMQEVERRLQDLEKELEKEAKEKLLKTECWMLHPFTAKRFHLAFYGAPVETQAAGGLEVVPGALVHGGAVFLE